MTEAHEPDVGPRQDGGAGFARPPSMGAGRSPAGRADMTGEGLLDLYDRALPQVYGYLLRRCDGRQAAEDLAAETFLAAVDAVRRGEAPALGLPWIIGVARHKLVDHWRRQERAERVLAAVAGEAALAPGEDPWNERLDAVAAHAVLGSLRPPYRAVLTLRYLDDLPVPEVAAAMGRSVHATEGLLVRARGAFRRVYAAGEAHDA